MITTEHAWIAAPVTEGKGVILTQSDRCWVNRLLLYVCMYGMLGERGLELVVHIPLGYVAKINIP